MGYFKVQIGGEARQPSPTIQTPMAHGHEVRFWWALGHQVIVGNKSANTATRAAMEETRMTLGELPDPPS